MPAVSFSASVFSSVPPELIKGKRHLTDEEIAVLKENRNNSFDSSWQNVYVSANPGEFNPRFIADSEINGWLVLGRLCNAKLKFHDLELQCGIYHSYIENIYAGDDVVIRNVDYLSNYHLGNRVLLFNIQEMSCTKHSKFGNGILKEGEPESNRVWIGVGNENDNRGVLPFESMIPADAYLWSRYRDDKELLKCFVVLTEVGNSTKLNTFGIVEDDVIIKNCTLLKDAKICNSAYIKGAFKLKNITVLSSPQESSQIGEGVELVNGIMGYGSRIFYQAVAVRFVIGRNCQLKYGARLLNSVLGDNSTVSCCELLNNLIFPFHEQHHNSSFLIASTVCGQSNIASNATIGSNHNSRSPDGEMFAGRGFWPGLCSDFKFNSRFASFVLVAKGSYQQELNITYPFSLVASESPCEPVHIIPAFWFLYNMYAVARNKNKFLNRDKRIVKVQHIETNPLAPDSVQEIMFSLERLIELTGRYLISTGDELAVKAGNGNELYHIAKDYLHQHPDADFILEDSRCQKKYGALIFKPVKAYKEYRKIVKYFAVSTFIDYCRYRHIPTLTQSELGRIEQMPLYTSWLNVGGQIIPEVKIEELFKLIKNHTVTMWEDVHAFYDRCDSAYLSYKTTYSLYLLEQLYSRPVSDFTPAVFEDIIMDVTAVSDEMYNSAFSSREKDYSDYFRTITYRNKAEMEQVLGTIDSNEFLQELKPETEAFNKDLKRVFKGLSQEKK
jgi:hypothetical protein